MSSPASGTSSKWVTPTSKKGSQDPFAIANALTEASKQHDAIESRRRADEPDNEATGEHLEAVSEEGAEARKEEVDAGESSQEEAEDEEEELYGEQFPVVDSVDEDPFDEGVNFESIVQSGPTSILLTGPKGCGKSTLGQGLSETLGMPYIDVMELVRKAEAKFAAKPREGDVEESAEEGDGANVKEALPTGSVDDPEWVAVQHLRNGESIPPLVLGQLVKASVQGLSLPRFIIDDEGVSLVDAAELFPGGKDGHREGLPTFAVSLHMNGAPSIFSLVLWLNN